LPPLVTHKAAKLVFVPDLWKPHDTTKIGPCTVTCANVQLRALRQGVD